MPSHKMTFSADDARFSAKANCDSFNDFLLGEAAEYLDTQIRMACNRGERFLLVSQTWWGHLSPHIRKLARQKLTELGYSHRIIGFLFTRRLKISW